MKTFADDVILTEEPKPKIKVNERRSDALSSAKAIMSPIVCNSKPELQSVPYGAYNLILQCKYKCTNKDLDRDETKDLKFYVFQHKILKNFWWDMSLQGFTEEYTLLEPSKIGPFSSSEEAYLDILDSWSLKREDLLRIL